MEMEAPFDGLLHLLIILCGLLKGYRSKNIENLSELFGKKILKKGLPQLILLTAQVSKLTNFISISK